MSKTKSTKSTNPIYYEYMKACQRLILNNLIPTQQFDNFHEDPDQMKREERRPNGIMCTKTANGLLTNMWNN